MDHQLKVHWRCADRQCEFSATLTLDEYIREIPLCRCGFPMQKASLSRAFAYLDFLRGDVPATNLSSIEKES